MAQAQLTPSDNSGSVIESLPHELCLQEPGATIQVLKSFKFVTAAEVHWKSRCLADNQLWYEQSITVRTSLTKVLADWCIMSHSPLTTVRMV